MFPYEYVDSFEKLQEKEFPPIEAFASKLNNKEKIDEDDYEYANMVYNELGCKSLMGYHNTYLAMDAMQLADVWKNFKAPLKKSQELDDSHYYTLPGYSWDALLLKSSQKLKLLSAIDMLLMIEKGTREETTRKSHTDTQWQTALT